MGLALCVALALSLACAASASAATPFHPRNPALDVEGINHACGVAVDTKGDLYAASAGAGKVLIFGPKDHETPIGEIANAKEPCALALTSKGALYVSEQATGEVVRYKPAKYPFEGAPSYGEREVIDPSGKAKGISVDPFDDRLYVADADHVSVYDSEGKLGVDEVQEVRCFGCTGGEYKLIFNGEETKSLKFESDDAIDKEVEAALLELAAFEPGDILIVNGSNHKAHLITFEGKYAHSDVPPFTANPGTIEGTGSKVSISETVLGFSGQIGAGQLTAATGVAAYTYKASGPSRTYHLAVADADKDEVKLFSSASFTTQKLRDTLTGTEGEEFGFGAKGAYLASDPGRCPPKGQACAAGHFFLYDDAHEVIEEFEADGELVSQTPFGFGDGAPTAIAIDRSGSEDDGALYATSGAGPGARALAFEPLKAPSRPGPEAPPLSLKQEKTCSIAIDDYGNRYVAVGPEVFVYPPAGSEPLVKVTESSGSLCRLAIDSEGNLYALLKEEVAYFKPSSYPPVKGTAYTKTTVVKQSEFGAAINALTVNPLNGHLFVNGAGKTAEYKAAKEGSGVLNPSFASSLSIGTREAIATCAKTGNVYIAAGGSVVVVNAAGTEIFTQITGVGSPSGTLGAHARGLAVDQSNCHVLIFEPEYKAIKEFEDSGAYLASFGAFTELVTTDFGVAVDNGSKSPNQGAAYLAYDDSSTYDLTAFGELEYPPPKPTPTTGAADGLAPGKATLNGKVNPNGAPLEACYFQYLTEAQYNEEGKSYAGAEEAPCAESPAEIGEGTSPVPVHASIEGLTLNTTYRFRLVAENEFGVGEGEGQTFALNPPTVALNPPQPLTYTEATLRGEVDPQGSPTTYHFEYLTQAHYEEASETFEGASETPVGELKGEGPQPVQAHLSGLVPDTEYRYRLLAVNAVGEAEAEASFTTLTEPQIDDCPNAAYRSGPSASLPDCRAYELVTLAQDNGYPPYWGASEANDGNFPTALAAADGQSMIFETEGPLPDTEGNGVRNGYRAERGPSGWDLSLYGPTYAETSNPRAGGVSRDHGYSFWTALGKEGSLDPEEGANNARYLALPEAGADPACSPEPEGRFELIGCGSEGADPEAIGRWISPGASHVIFTSDAQLEPEAPAKGTAIYDRSPGGPTHVVSLLPGDETPSGPATYQGVSADGSAVAFSLEGTLYVRLDDIETQEIGAGAIFAGLARDGSALFYLQGGALWRYDTGEEASTQIAPGGDFVNVSSEGASAYFTSTEELAEGAEAGEDNLYRWEAEGDETRFVVILDPADVSGGVNLAGWVEGLNPSANGTTSGPAMDPSRSTPDGGALLFESHAPLTGYDAEGHTEVFRYEAAGESLACLSCGPEGTTASSDAQLQDEGEDSPISSGLAPIANLSEDGDTAFFTSAEALLPADQNEVADVYEWREGALSLISSGQSRRPSILYAVSASGEDVFFSTHEKLAAGGEEEGGRMIYDARVGGGFPAPPEPEVCEGESCAEPPSAPPTPPELVNPPSTNSLPPEPPAPKTNNKHKCPKGKRKVKRHGKVSCVKPHANNKHAKHRHRRTAR